MPFPSCIYNFQELLSHLSFIYLFIAISLRKGCLSLDIVEDVFGRVSLRTYPYPALICSLCHTDTVPCVSVAVPGPGTSLLYLKIQHSASN